MKTIVFFACLGSVTWLHAEVKRHPFAVESGMIIYEISGGGELTPETNVMIKGYTKLHFKEWGEVKLEEEEALLLTTGAIEHKQHVKRLEKHTKDTVITADYANEKLLKYKKSSYDINGDDATASLTKTGEEMVAGVLCEVWEGEGIRKCIYKNIVLKLESNISDILYVKEATKAIFDTHTSSEAYAVPDFPVQKFALFKDDIKTKNAEKIENFYTLLKEAALGGSDINASDSHSLRREEERREFINDMTQDIFERQKELLPELLNAFKETRVCLQTEEDPFMANSCIEHFNHMKAQLGTQEDAYMRLWDEKRKNRLLDKIEDDLIYLQSRISCVNRAQNMTDLSACMK